MAEKADNDKWDAFCDGAGIKATQIKALEAAMEVALQTDSGISEVDQAFTKFLSNFGLDCLLDECKRRGIKTLDVLVQEKLDADKWKAFCDDAGLTETQIAEIDSKFTRFAFCCMLADIDS